MMTYYSIRRSLLLLICSALPYFSFSQATWQLVFKEYDVERNNAVVHHRVFPFQEGEVSVGNTKWEVTFQEEKTSLPEGISGKKMTVKWTLLEGEIKGAWGIQQKVENWSKAHYVLMPGAVYQGNRFEVRKMNYTPRLWDIRDINQENPIFINDIPRLNIRNGTSKIQLKSGAMAFPSMSYWNPEGKNYTWFLTEQANSYGDYLFSVEESNDRGTAWLTVSSPGVRENGRFRWPNNTDAHSTDKPASFQKGSQLAITLWEVRGTADKITDFYTSTNVVRELAEGGNDVLAPYLPLSKSFEIQEKKFNEQSWIEEYSYYAEGVAKSQKYHVGWTGGTFSTYALWMMGGDTTRQRIIRNLDWLFGGRITDIGFFWDRVGKRNERLGGHGYTPDWHSTRRNGDGLYYALKHLTYMKSHDEPIKEHWWNGTKKVTDAFVNLWKEHGQLGQFIDVYTGKITINGTAAGAVVPAALVMAANLYDEPSYLEVAKEMTQYFYEHFTQIGLTYGSPGDIFQAPDSESAYALLLTYMVLYEQTKEDKYLKMAKEASDQFNTWVVTYNYEFPETTTFGRLGLPSKGAVIANAQNTHAAAGICTHSGVELLKLYRITGDEKYLDVLLDIVRIMPHHLNQGERIFPKMKEGWMTERVNLNDQMGGIGEYFAGSTWVESAFLLANAEIPSIYVDLEKGKAFTFDHVETALTKKGKRWFLSIKNPTKHTATVTVIAENNEAKSQQWKDFFRNTAIEATLQPNEEKQIRLK